MARPSYYVPAISRPLVAALYHESKVRHVPMTKLVDELLRRSLAGTPGWKAAAAQWPELEVAARQQDGAGNTAGR